MVANVRPSVVCPIVNTKQAVYETLLGRWRCWFCCCIQILLQKPPGEIFWFQIQNTCKY